jgi:hypothetical protein
MNDEGLADAAAANPFRLPTLHAGIVFTRATLDSGVRVVAGARRRGIPVAVECPFSRDNYERGGRT